MAKITQNQILSENIFGIEQAENIVKSSGGGSFSTKNENDKVTITDTLFAQASVTTNAGKDEILVKKGSVKINSGADDDKITVNKDVSYAKIDDLYGDDIITTSAKLTEMYFNYGDDTITAKAGQTYIDVNTVGTSLDSRLEANRGDDVIKQGKGEIYLRFKEGVTLEDTNYFVVMEQNKNDLIIKFKDQAGNYSSSITVQNHFKQGEKSSFKGFVFADDPTVSYFVKNGQGALTQMPIPQEAEPVFNQIDGGYADILIKGTKGNDSIMGYNGKETIYAGAGNDIIDSSFSSYSTMVFGEAGNDTIIAIGDDTINGGKGNNTINLNTSTGGDVSHIVSGGGTDTIVFANNYSDLTYSRDGNNLIITATHHEDDSKAITAILDNYFGLKGKHSVKYIETSYDAASSAIVSDKKILLENAVTLNNIYAEMDKKNNLKGTVYGDNIVGSNFNDTVKAGKGADKIYGGDGNDKLYGEDGNDTIDGGAGNDTIYGGKGSNYITTGLGDDVVYCDKNGNTVVTVNGGTNKIYSSQGANYFDIKKEAGTTYIYNATANDTLGMWAFDSVAEEVKFEWDETFKDKNFYISHEESGTYVVLVDYFKAKNGNFLNTVDWDSGNGTTIDSFYKKPIDEYQINMSELGVSKYTGSNLSDNIYGREGNDTIYGGYGNDSIVCDTGNDKIYGQYGNDTIYAVQGNKYIDGGAGDDSITASKVGKHTLNGGTGNDTISYNAGANVTINGGDGNDSITADFVTSYDGKAKITAGAGNDYIKTLNGKLNDYIDAGAGNDTIIAYDGKDTLNGGKGNDDYRKIFENSEGTVITDTAGSYDVLRLQTNIEHDGNVGLEKGDATIFFDLKLDKKGNIVNNSSTDLYLSSVENVGDKKESIAIKNYFKSGYEIEKIIIEGTQLNYSITEEKIDQLRSDIAGWLANHDYTSTAQAFKDNNADAMQEYLAIVDNAIGW